MTRDLLRYQCNLMVYEPGGYNFVDYIKFGVPLQIVCAIFTVAIVFSLEHWWAYAVVLGFLSPAVVILYFFVGADKASVRENITITDNKTAALEEGHAATDKTTSPSPEVGLHPIGGGNVFDQTPVVPVSNGSGSDPTSLYPISTGNGSESAQADRTSTSSALIFTGNA